MFDWERAMNRLWVVAAAAIMVAGGAGVLAKPSRPDTTRQRPETFEALVRCRSIADEKQRLACYDGAAAALEQAADRHDLVVIDRKQVRETKRTLFGLELPRLSIFGGGNDDAADEVKEVEGVVQTAFQDGNGRWVVTLADGATWAQIDNSPIAFRPKAGQKVRIHRGAIGSYIMNINGQPGVKARRQL
ncbi:MAG: hypothetical protein QOG84_2761 [Sphingomonadales bacterium]|jgi:hypothetical protein|nr:hypothetical protein [Sphingomonadales bacterium]